MWKLMGKIVKITLQDRMIDGGWNRVIILYDDDKLDGTSLGIDCDSSLMQDFNKIENGEYKAEKTLNLYENINNFYGKYKITLGEDK